MAQLNLTLNQEEILLLLSENRDEAFRTLLQSALNSFLKAESNAQLHAEPYERTDARTDSRNGNRERPLTTRIGKITLTVPRHRNQPFHTMIFENYKRSEAALIATMAEMVVTGVSTRKVSRVMETLCETPFSKSSVSEVSKELDKGVKEFQNRRLTKLYPFVMVDATYFKVRENHRVTGKALMVAIGTTEEAKREIIGFGVYDSETKNTWKDFLNSMKSRGLQGVKMITSDAHEGIIYAIGQVFPDVPWQRCQAHFSRNVLDHAPKKYQTAIHDAMNEMYNCKTIEEARQKRDAIISEYGDVAEKAMQCLDNGFETAMTVMILPQSLRLYFRTSNHLERLNRELKRRSVVIGIFPNTESLNRLMGSVLLEENAKYLTISRLHFKKAEYAELENLEFRLRNTAREQQRVLAA